jgi:hypothetical protein
MPPDPALSQGREEPRRQRPSSPSLSAFIHIPRAPQRVETPPFALDRPSGTSLSQRCWRGRSRISRFRPSCWRWRRQVFIERLRFRSRAPARAHPQHFQYADARMNGRRNHIARLDGMGGLRHLFAVHPNLAFRHQPAGESPRLDETGVPEPLVQPSVRTFGVVIAASRHISRRHIQSPNVFKPDPEPAVQASP